MSKICVFDEPKELKLVNNGEITKLQITNFVFSDIVESCNYTEYIYVIAFNNYTYATLKSERVLALEELFPEFPYSKNTYNHKQTMKAIADTNNRIDKLVSHLETLMIALGQRKASEDNMEI